MPEQELQTITYDDFERSLKEDGIEIIYSEEEEEKPDGVGATGYTARLTAPSTTNPYYLKQGYGGYNRCILIQGNSCLPNCVGYAHGRSLEIGGATSNTKLPICNAEDWLAVARTNGLKTGNTPKLGAVIVWKSGNLWNGNDGCGHVGVVEVVNADGTITVSQSNYGGTRFFLTKHKPPYDILGQKFIGFIYSPYINDAPEPEPEPKWVQDAKGQRCLLGNGNWAKNQWVTVGGKTYHVDANGYMEKHKWITEKDGTKRFVLDHGVMAASRWCKLDGNWYFFGRNGEMFVGYHNVPVRFDKNGKFIGFTK